ncbi:Quinolinate phosphoribosyl transferase, partial [Suillus lakei]
YFKLAYLNYIQCFRFKPKQISVTFIPSSDDPDMGSVKIEAKGTWLETVLWEVPLMACLCEMYFRYADQDWDYTGQEGNKFGMRRRRSFIMQDLVVKGIVKARDAYECKDGFFETSNVYLAMRYNLNAIGTIAVLYDYKDAAGTALDLWSKLYGDSLSVTLTDTFPTEVFYQEFDVRRANQWNALRQDSGDLKKAKELNQQCQQLRFKCMSRLFGIGTWLTNDFKKKSSGYKEQSKALNIVIKLGAIDGKECVKISDEITKNTGVREVVAKVKVMYQILLS